MVEDPCMDLLFTTTFDALKSASVSDETTEPWKSAFIFLRFFWVRNGSSDMRSAASAEFE